MKAKCCRCDNPADSSYPCYCRSCSASLQRGYARRLRLAAVEVLGNKCVKCGFSDERALQIDHVHGGGRKERREHYDNSTYMYRRIRDGDITDYQLLCANCNQIKKTERKELPGG